MKWNEIKDFFEKMKPYEIEDRDKATIEEITEFQSILTKNYDTLCKVLRYQINNKNDEKRRNG